MYCDNNVSEKRWEIVNYRELRLETDPEKIAAEFLPDYAGPSAETIAAENEISNENYAKTLKEFMDDEFSSRGIYGLGKERLTEIYNDQADENKNRQRKTR